MEKIAVLIPCYNECQTIDKVIREFKSELPEATIYVYDNNSTDNSDKIALEAGAVVRYEHKQGKGNVVRRMFEDIDAECYIMVDGDDTYSAKSARQMVNLVLDNKVDMVIGDRLSSTYFTENKRKFHNIGNKAVRWTINKLFRSDIKDIMTGYRAFSYKFAKIFPARSAGFEIETEMTIYAIDRKLHTENLIIEYKDRPEGSTSKLNTYKDGFKVMLTILKLFKEYQPLNFYKATAVMILMALVLTIPIQIHYI